MKISAQDGGHGCVTARRAAAARRLGWWACGDLAAGNVEDGLSSVRGFWWVGRLGGGFWGRGRDGEEGALVGFGVANQGRNVVVREEGVGKDFGRGETSDDARRMGWMLENQDAT